MNNTFYPVNNKFKYSYIHTILKEFWQYEVSLNRNTMVWISISATLNDNIKEIILYNNLPFYSIEDFLNVTQEKIEAIPFSSHVRFITFTYKFTHSNIKPTNNWLLWIFSGIILLLIGIIIVMVYVLGNPFTGIESTNLALDNVLTKLPESFTPINKPKLYGIFNAFLQFDNPQNYFNTAVQTSVFTVPEVPYIAPNKLPEFSIKLSEYLYALYINEAMYGNMYPDAVTAIASASGEITPTQQNVSTALTQVNTGLIPNVIVINPRPHVFMIDPNTGTSTTQGSVVNAFIEQFISDLRLHRNS